MGLSVQRIRKRDRDNLEEKRELKREKKEN